MEKNRNLDRVMETETISKNGVSSKSRMSRGNFLRKTCFTLLNVLAGVLMIAVFTACGGSGSGGGSYKIKMTTESGGYISLYLFGTGIATIDWGDGSEKDALTIDNGARFEHTYLSASIRTITINGNIITGLRCSSITSLDLSKNKELTYLSVKGIFKSIDVSKNTELTSLVLHGGILTSLDLSNNSALTYLEVGENFLTTDALNTLFSSLHNNTVPPDQGFSKAKLIEMHYSYAPDSPTGDRSIAERKGWTFQ